MANVIVDAIVDNPLTGPSDRSLVENHRRLARLAALLHDLPNIPHGHSLEDELAVISPKHDSRGEYERFFDYPDVRGALGDDRDVLLDILPKSSPDEGAASTHPSLAFIPDIVANTISADLLDYLMRDYHFVGLLAGGVDKRLIKYFTVSAFPPPSGAAGAAPKRVILELQKSGALRRDNISEVFRLLRLRYYLGERVYYHHTKIAATAMLAKAIHEAGFSRQVLINLSDEGVLRRLQNSKTSAAARSIARQYQRRLIFRPAYVVRWKHAFPDAHDKPGVRLEPYLGNPSSCRDLEADIGRANGIDPNHIAVYAPKAEFHASEKRGGMSFKQADVLVRWPMTRGDPMISKLSDVDEEDIREEIETLRLAHRNLWQFGVFVSRLAMDGDSKCLRRVAAWCFRAYDMRNDLPDYKLRG